MRRYPDLRSPTAIPDVVRRLCLQAAVILAAACTASSESPFAAGGSGGTAAAGGHGGSPVGAGGAAGDDGEGSGGGTAEALPDWLLEPDAWEPVPGDSADWTSGCEVRVGRMDRIRMPPLRWESCGPGCERADVVQGLGDSASIPVMTTHFDSEGSVQVFLRVLHRPVRARSSNVALRRIVELESGRTVAALRQAPPDDCLPALTTESSALAIELLLTGRPELRKLLGVWDPATEAWRWMRPWPKSSDVPLYPNTILESPLHRLFTVEQIVVANMEPGSSELVRVAELPDTFATSSGGNAELFLWAEVFLRHSESRLVRWRPGTLEHEAFVERIDGDVCKVGVGGGTIGGFLVRPDGPRSCNYMHDDARFFRVVESDDRTVEMGPILPGRLRAFDFEIWSNFAAAAVTDEHAAGGKHVRSAFVTRLSDWKSRQVLPSPGQRVTEVALSERYLFVIESPDNKDYLRYWEVRRYDLERMDEWGVEVATTP